MAIKNQKSKIKNPPAFTLIELLVVVGIIGVLVAILIPVIGKVRASAQSADTKNFLNQLVSAIERYHNDFRAYPGPLKNSDIRPAATPVLPIYDITGGTVLNDQVTGTENLVLGLCGGLKISANKVVFDPDQVGRGPINLNVASPKRFEPYADKANLSKGSYSDELHATIADSPIPEFMDRYPAPLPILYYRAKPGAQRDPALAIGEQNNNVITKDSAGTGHYQLSDGIAYTQNYTVGSLSVGIGTEKNAQEKYFLDGSPVDKTGSHGLNRVFKPGGSPTPNSMKQGDASYTYPYDAYAYFLNKTTAGVEPQPRAKDTYILISAGPDRVYGTEDDIASFGDVQP